ncbi:hypothetical protein AAF712_015880 [Marasmius tenuissimus]|uniref:Uncharacterized protein n=1 Tax=Marasmius tenuissimus TaxID=585030 RepID=A0ABR2Z7B9_9AGAR
MASDLEDGVKYNLESEFEFGSRDGTESNPDDTSESDPQDTSNPEARMISPKDDGTMTRWVKRLGFLKNAYTSPSRDESNPSRVGGPGKGKEIDSDSWSLVDC